MLRYRQYNPLEKEVPLIVSDDLIPAYLKSEIDEETDKLIKDQLEIEQKLLTIKLKVYHLDEVKTLSFKKNDVYRDVAT